MGNQGTISTCSGQFFDSGGSGGNYGVNDNYTLTFCSNSSLPIIFQFVQFDMGLGFGTLTVYDGPNISSPQLGVFSTGSSPGTLASTNVSNCLTFVFNGGGFAISPGSGWQANITCGTPPPPPAGTQCATMQPFCTNTNYNFPAATNTTAESGPDYDCLSTQPNPVWYYLQIDNSGFLDITLSNTANVDVDFACWGPFTSLAGVCNQLISSNVVDCSYSTAATEYINISGAQTGQYYVLCITNYSNSPTNFTLTTSGSSTASTNCQILCNITAMTATSGVCDPTDNLHDISGTLTISYPPSSGTLTITTNTGQTTTLTGPFSSPLNYSLNNISSTGGPITVTAQFSTDTSCHFTTTYQSPAPCTCTANASNTSPVCSGGDVSLQANTLAGATYQWSGPNGFSSNQQNPTLTGVTTTQSGIYTVTVSLGGCTATDTTLISIVSSPSITLNPLNVSCNGLNDGSVTATSIPSGLNFIWNNGATTSSISSLSPGTYSVTGSLGSCSASASTTITEPSSISLGNPIVTDASCSSGGSISLIASGGTGTLVYSWSNGQSGSTLSNIPGGIYVLTVTDANMCSTSASYNVGASSNSIVINPATITPPSCSYSTDGSISVSVSGGTGTIVYAWSNTATSQNISGLNGGVYGLTVSDQNNCSTSVSYVVTPPAVIAFSPPSITDASCSVGGSIEIFPSGGAGGFTYLWSNNQTNNPVTNLAAGVYTVTVSDQTQCTASASYTVGSSPGVIVFGNAFISNESCPGASDGSITITYSGGIGSVSFSWSNSQTGVSISDLGTGTYTVTATDANSCSAVQTYTVGVLPLIQANITPTNATCFGAANGSISLSASGGTPPYNYLWSDSQTTSTAYALSAGSHSCVVTDSKGCSQVFSGLINQPVDMIINTSATAVKCIGDANGTISVSATGGTPPYTFSSTQDWSNFDYATNGIIINLAVGTYDVIVSDSNGCTKVVQETVPNASLDEFTTSADSTSCYGDTYLDGAAHIVATSIQNGPYEFGIDGGLLQYSGDFYFLGAGLHTITAVNRNGCTSQVPILISEPLPIVVDVVPDTVVIELGESAQVTVNYINAQNVWYTWSPSKGLSCIDCANPVVSSYQSGDYIVTVSSQNGTAVCFGSATLRVEVLPHKPIFIPNSFTPNGDGNNDRFLIFGTDIKTVDLKIFNRWGELVFATTNAFEGWDGTYKGELQLPQVFTYTARVTFLDNKKAEQNGSITLIR